jgi:hypothetical protein
VKDLDRDLTPKLGVIGKIYLTAGTDSNEGDQAIPVSKDPADQLAARLGHAMRLLPCVRTQVPSPRGPSTRNSWPRSGTMGFVTTRRHAQDSSATRLAKKFVPAIGLALGIAIFVIAFVVANTDNETPAVFTSPVIDALTPLPGSEVLRQSQVGIDLVSGYEAELVLNDTPIPPDQINVLRNPADPDESTDQAGAFSETINRFLYQPLEGRAVPALRGDENCVVATFWPIADPTDIDSVEWCFTVA